MMQVMPVALGVCNRKTFDRPLFFLDIGNHLFNGYMIIGDGRSLPLTFYSAMFQLNDKGRLVRFSAFGDGKRVVELKIIRIVRADHGGQTLLTTPKALK